MAHNTKGQGLILSNVSTEYHKRIIVGGVFFSVLTEKVTVLVRANSCEKSTLLSTVTHILQPMDGSILLDGRAIHEQPTKALSRRFGISLQSPLLPGGLTIYELILRGRLPWQSFIRQWDNADELTTKEALKLTGTQEFAHLPVEKLSGGQHQRYWITMVLVQKTPCVLLDEPTAWLDLRYRVGILELLHGLTRHHGRIVVMVLHDLNFAVSYGDTLIFLRQRKMVRVLNEREHCTPELVKAASDVDVHASINPLTGGPYFMPFRGVEKVWYAQGWLL